MYIKWAITDDLTNLSLSDFNSEYNGIYGFIKLIIGNNEVGEYYKCDSGEGDYDILYYLSQLIKCGISMLKNRNYNVMLLNSNLAELNIVFDKNVNISFISAETKEVYWTSSISRQELIHEIEDNYREMIIEIEKINPQLLNSKLLQNFKLKYNEFLELYKCDCSYE